MTKSLMISIRPQHAFNILNGKKTLELRTWIPKDYVGWVYVYVTKKYPLLNYIDNKYELMDRKNHIIFHNIGMYEFYNTDIHLNGKVVFRFWFDETYYIKQAVNVYGDELNQISIYDNKSYGWKTPKEQQEILKQLCLTEQEVLDYGKGKDLYAWHIKKLEVFDEPKSLSDFYNVNIDELLLRVIIPQYIITKAPQRSVWVYTKELENE